MYYIGIMLSKRQKYIFRKKRGGASGSIQNFLNRKISDVQIDRGGGLARSDNVKKKQFFLFDCSPYGAEQPDV